MNQPASVFVLLRVNPHPEEVLCLRWKKDDAVMEMQTQQLLYPSAAYEVVEWFVR